MKVKFSTLFCLVASSFILKAKGECAEDEDQCVMDAASGSCPQANVIYILVPFLYLIGFIWMSAFSDHI